MKTKTLSILLILISLGLSGQKKFHGNWIITNYTENMKNEDYLEIDSLIPVEIQAFEDSIIESTEPLITFISIKPNGEFLFLGTPIERGKWEKIDADTILITHNDWNGKAITDSTDIIVFDNLESGKYIGIRLPENRLKDSINLSGEKITFHALTLDNFELKIKNDSILDFKNRYGKGKGKYKLQHFEDFYILDISLDNYTDFVFYLYAKEKNEYYSLIFNSELNVTFGERIETKLIVD